MDWDSFFTLFYGPLAFVPETVRQHGLEEVDESLMRSCILANEDPEVKAIELEWDEIRDAIEEPWSDAPTL